MKTTRYSEPQILAILRQAEGGVPVTSKTTTHWLHSDKEGPETDWTD